MKLLSVAKLHEASSSSEDSSENESAEALVQVNIEVVRSSFLTTHEVGECDPSADKGEGASLGTTDELEVVVNIEEVQVEHLGVVLDQFDWSNFLRQLLVNFFNVVMVSVNACTVTSHFFIY